MTTTEEVKVINSWSKFGPGVEPPVEVHLRVVLYDNQYYIELRDYYPDRDHYGAGYLVSHAGRLDPVEESKEVSSLVQALMEYSR